MSTDREVTRIVRSWLQKDEHESAETLLSTVLDRLDTTPQRRPVWRAWRPNLMNGTLKFAAAGAVVLVLAVAGLALYFSRPAVVPAGSPTPFDSPSSVAATPTPAQPSPTQPVVSVQPTATVDAATAPWILFQWRVNGEPPSPRGPSGVWAMRADGTGAHSLDAPPAGISESAWSKDGRQLLVASSYRLYLAEVDDEIGPFVDTGFNTEGETACIEKSRKPFPCQDAAFDFAPDGERIVFVQRCTYELPGCYFLTILNLATGVRTEIYQAPPSRGGLSIELPAWSPDGSQIAFGMSRADTFHTDLWVINADGTGLRQIDVGDHLSFVQGPRWSPDGTRIAFTTFSETEQMVYAINSDPESMGGAAVSSFNVLGSDGVCCGEWVANGQLRVRALGVFEEEYPFYTADDHGSSTSYLFSLDDALAAIDPAGQVTQVGVPGDPGRVFLWQPSE